MSNFIVCAQVERHAVNAVVGPDSHTLCGLDADDSPVGHRGTEKSKGGQKIECRQCYNVLKDVTEMRLRESVFDLAN